MAIPEHGVLLRPRMGTLSWLYATIYYNLWGDR